MNPHFARLKTGFRLFTLFALLAAGGVTFSACEDVKIIDRVSTKVSSDLQSIRVSLLFQPSLEATFSGGFPLKNYGTIFVNPSTASAPFEVGFDLDTDIVNEQDYLHLQPTTVLPNGYPLGVPNPVVEVKSEMPIGSGFDAYAYVDVLRKNWVGAASMIRKMTELFPEGLVVSQVFMKDPNGEPAVIGHAYGPVWNENGTLRSAGGVAVLANVRYLIDRSQASRTTAKTKTLRSLKTTIRHVR
jgi:hypothetical protein